jgi:uncharacterized protein YjbI with pentapeptide repeats
MKTKTDFSVASTCLSADRITYHEAWLWRWRLGPGRLVLEDENLTHANITGNLSRSRFLRCDLSRSTLWFTHFDKAEFVGCMLEDGALSGMKLGGAKLQECSFDRSRVDRGGFETAVVHGCSFVDAKLVRTFWTSAEVSNVTFRGATMVAAELTDGRFVDCDFSGVDLRRDRWPGTGTANARFERCDFRGAKFEEHQLAGAVFHECKLDSTIGGYR